MTATILTWTRRLVLLLMLPLACLVGSVAPYVVALALIGVFLLLLVQRKLFATYREPLPALFLIAFLMLGVCFAITADEPRDALSAFNFVMLLLAGPLVYALAQGAGAGNAERVAWFALAGAAISLVIAAVQLARGIDRGTWETLGPIRMANTAVVLGFLALLGWFQTEGKWRFIFLLGPVIGVAVTFLTLSRGPLVAIALALPVAFVFVLRTLPRRALPFAVVGVVLLVVVGLGVLVTSERVARLPEVIGTALAGETVADNSVRIRLMLYEAAAEAFTHAPWIGYGWHNMMEAIAPYLAEGASDYVRRLPQLHNDALDFAVAAGAVGVAAYLLLLAAPIVAALRSAHDSQRLVRLYGCAVLVVCYVGAGATDLMFGFEFHTALYVALAAILIGYCRDATSPQKVQS